MLPALVRGDAFSRIDAARVAFGARFGLFRGPAALPAAAVLAARLLVTARVFDAAFRGAAFFAAARFTVAFFVALFGAAFFGEAFFVATRFVVLRFLAGAAAFFVDFFATAFLPACFRFAIRPHRMPRSPGPSLHGRRLIQELRPVLRTSLTVLA